MQAYAHLVHYGACAKGVAPLCFGWLEVPDVLLAKIPGLFKLRSSATPMAPDTPTFKALLLEHIPNAEKLSISNMTLDVTHQLLRGLVDIHMSYVCRGRLRASDMWLVPENGGVTRVLWIDFMDATCASDGLLCKRDFFMELRAGWEYLYARLVSTSLGEDFGDSISQ